MRVSVILAFLAVFLLSPNVWAESNPSDTELDSLKKQIESLRKDFGELQERYESDVVELHGQIRELSDELEASRAAEGEILQERISAPMPVAPSGISPSYGRGSWQSFNPDISVIGDVLGQYTSHENEGDRPDDEVLFRELEINFSGALDPFARADITTAIEKESGDEFAIGIEEAYLTMLSLPYGFQARVGRMRERFGKTNVAHLHALPWVEYPLIIQNYFGEEGLIGDGAELSWLAPTQHYLELSYEAFNNDNDSVFAGEDYDDFAHLVHAKNLFEFSDATTLELGGTVATAPNDNGHGGNRTWLEGIDLTLKWRPPQEALYKGLTWQTEALFSQKDAEEGESDTWGLYSSIEYQFARRWRAAARYDYSELPDYENLHENGYSAYLTFAQSEYVFWRFGYMFIDRNFPDPVEEDEHVLWLQCNFGLGVHRAHQY